MAARVVVVGGGVAGLAAAWSARQAGADVTLVHAHAGASALYSGALDEHRAPSSEQANALTRFAVALGGWHYGSGPHRIVTETGLCRAVAGKDTALLDLEPTAGRVVGVLDAVHTSWNAVLVARELESSAWAKRTKTRFTVVAAADLLSPAEAAVPCYDLARRFDRPERQAAAAKLLSEAKGDCAALLCGPWLGLEVDVAETLSASVGIAVGETTSAPGGVAGARFELARERLLSGSEITVLRERAKSVEPRPNGLRVTLLSRELDADAVVLALGGVAAGGIIVDDARPDHPGGACFHASVEAPIALQLDGRAVERASTLHGIDFCLSGLDTLQRVGIAAKDGATATPGLFVAGDCEADAPRAVLHAANRGLVVGLRAARGAAA